MKFQRHNAIRELVAHALVANQDELRRKLRRRGFEVTQATLSRDIRELGVVKTSDGYQLAVSNFVSEPVLPSVSRLVREFVVDVRLAQNLLVLKTSVGSAQPVAAAIDAEDWPEVVGTLAGDDTILIISPDNRTAQQLARKIHGMLER